MAETIDEIGIEYSEDDKLLLKQIEKRVLTRGNWSTIMFLFQELNKNTDEYGPLKVSIRRYQKRNGAYRQQSKFNISNAKQAREMVKILNEWFPEGASDDAAASTAEETSD